MNLYFEVEECFRSHSFEFRSKFTSDEHEGQKT
ncbi:hypothetical protein PMI35_01154 [Pseudomonas sp. GM78]|nr:hypothetical protein PMI35_01154 [Pseudomonas sp. GM78]